MVLGVGFSFAWVEEGYHGCRFLCLVVGDREKEMMRRGEKLGEEITGTLEWLLLFLTLDSIFFLCHHQTCTKPTRLVLSLLSRYRCYRTGRTDAVGRLFMPCLTKADVKTKEPLDLDHNHNH
jgi:hypothetical protein